MDEMSGQLFLEPTWTIRTDVSSRPPVRHSNSLHDLDLNPNIMTQTGQMTSSGLTLCLAPAPRSCHLQPPVDLGVDDDIRQGCSDVAPATVHEGVASEDAGNGDDVAGGETESHHVIAGHPRVQYNSPHWSLWS